MPNFASMRTISVALAIAVALSTFGQTDAQNQVIRRGILWRAGIVGSLGLLATQSRIATHRDAGWAMFAASSATIVTVQVIIGDDPSKDRPRRRFLNPY